MTVGKFCNREVIIADKESSIVEIARLMRRHHVGDVILVTGSGDRSRPVGILTDRDIVIELIACDVPLDSVCAGDVMSYELVTAREEDSIWDTLKRMRAKGIRRMPVVNDKDELEVGRVLLTHLGSEMREKVAQAAFDTADDGMTVTV